MSAATVAAIAKAAVAVLSNEKTRKALGWVIVAILSPLIVLVVLICAVLSGSSQHNVSAVELCFHGGTISSSATPEYRGYIEDMRGSFAQLDRAIEEINAQCEDGNSLDDTRVKAVFYALYFAAEHPDDSGIRAFTDCFVDYEERTRTVTTTDEEGNEVEVEETYTVAIPVTDMNEVYARIEAAMGITVTPENQSNADSIYNIVLYGTATGTGDWFPGADVPFISVDGFCSPVGANWESIVTSEFGYRRDPFKEEQLSSYEAQIEYYTEKIDANPDWTMVRLYADEGITGTSAKKRKDFLQMIRDCERGKIDLVITKSVSRFCRNTLDGLNYVRRLKRHGVGVYFEKENVNTLFMDNEMILTFMMSQAQAESESLSGNVKWGHRKNFKDGKVYYHCKNFLGYRWGADGQPEIDPEQAAVVRRIFSRFLLGHSVRQITTDLMTDGIKTATGKTVWHDSVIQKMLCNEKYIGDALLQKTYIADLFTREKRINNGELPKYYVHDCHPAIIDRGTFQKVQEELARRSSLKKTSSKAKTQLGKYCGKYVLSELLVCGECGSPYRRVIWTQKGVKRVVWRCQNRLEHGRKICKHSPTLDEGDIHDAVISAMNELFQTQAARNAVKASISAVLAGEEQTLSLPAVELQIRNLQERQLELFQLIVSAGADCTDYDEELRQVNMAKTKLMAKKAELEKEQRGAAAFEERLAELDAELEQSCGALTDFDELTVRQLVSNIKVLDKDSLLICFKDGTEITQAMQRRQTA